MPVQPHSSADAYAQRSDSRPCSSLSMVSGSGEQAESSPRLGELNFRRASVLSFQTALSGELGAFNTSASFEDAHRTRNVGSAELEHLDETPPPKPWLFHPSQDGSSANGMGKGSNVSSHSSSVDDRLPGGWRAKGWPSELPDSSSHAAPSNSLNLTAASAAGRRGSQSPRARLSALADVPEKSTGSSSLNASPSNTFSTRTLAQSPTYSRLDTPTARSPGAALNNGSFLSPSTVQDVLHSPASGTSTIGGASKADVDPIVRAAAMLSTDTLAPALAPKRQGTLSTITPELVDAEWSQERRTPIDVTPANVDFDLVRPTPSHRTSAGERQTLPSSSTGAARGSIVSPPVLPEKMSPPVPTKDRPLATPSTPPLSDDVSPQPVSNTATPSNAVSPPQLEQVHSSSATSSKPANFNVQDNRSISLSNSKAAADKSRDLPSAPPAPIAKTSTQSQEPARPTSIGAGVGAHNIRTTSNGEISPAFAVMMRDGGGFVQPRPRTEDDLAPVATVVDARASSPDIETPPREPSPPPEGEVEARAEWERAQMRRLAEQSKAKVSSNGARKTTFRGQLKPLQLVAAEEAKQQARRESALLTTSATNSPELTAQIRPDKKVLQRESLVYDKQGDAEKSPVINSSQQDAVNGSPAIAASSTKNAGGEVLSTQQLQRMSARDSRLSVSAVQIAGGVNEIGGAYPVFASPVLSASRTGTRQYSGIMPQRSLVPPFELQNRPDGLPSALTGPDGVRRSPNDPDVCLECMMRDEDMIDVHVLGAGLWERESDKDFDDACRIEAEELRSIASGDIQPIQQGNSVNSHGGGTVDSGSHSAQAANDGIVTRSRLTKIRVKRVAKGEPLTAERLKLHTQMNPPASSHRWRTLQTFLAVQAKYIAMDQRARGISPAVPSASVPSYAAKQVQDYDNLMIRTTSADSKRANLPQNLIKVDERQPLTTQERLQKEKDIALAREARRRNAASAPDARGVTSAYATGASVTGKVNEAGGYIEDDFSSRPISTQMLRNENSSGHQSIPRRSDLGMAPPFVRTGNSTQDLRSKTNAMQKSLPLTELPPSPVSALVPPTPPFRSSTPQAFGGRGMNTSSSQMSLTHSGSMIDMHVAAEDKRDHRISQAGFLPGTPLQTSSPSTFNRAYYGFPGDGEESTPGVSGSGDRFDDSNELDGRTDSREFDSKKSKKKGSSGLRSLFGKLSAKVSTPPLDSSAQTMSPFDTEDRSAELAPPPSMGGLINRARRSTSSLLNISGRPSMDGSTMLNDRLGLPVLHSPAMASQGSIDMGPFGAGPLPPPRAESRDVVSSPGQEWDGPRARTMSAGNSLNKRKVVTSSEFQSGALMDGKEQQRSPPVGDNSRQFNKQAPLRKSNLSEQFLAPAVDLAPTHDHLDSRQQGVLPPESARDSQWRASTQKLTPRQGKPALVLDHVNGDVPIADVNAQESSGQTRPTRPPRNPQRGTPSQPASEHTAGDSASGFNVNTNTPSPLASLRPLSEVGQLPGQTGTIFMSTNAGRPVSDAQMLDLRSSQFNSTLTPGYANANTHGPVPSRSSGMQAFPSTVYPGEHAAAPGFGQMHSRSGSVSDGLAAGYEADESFNSQRSRAVSSSAPTTRKSRLLKLPFGKNKRESVADSTVTGSSKANRTTTPSLKSRSSRGTFDDLTVGGSLAMNNGFAPTQHTSAHATSSGRPMSTLQQQRGYQGNPYGRHDASSTSNLGAQESRLSMLDSMESGPANTSASPLSIGLRPWLRNRRGSNSFDERNGTLNGLPPRSQSALGMRDGNQFDDEPTPSHNPKRGLLPKLRTASRSALRAVNED